jgi:hypothetical protein
MSGRWSDLRRGVMLQLQSGFELAKVTQTPAGPLGESVQRFSAAVKFSMMEQRMESAKSSNWDVGGIKEEREGRLPRG